jgi:CheY-like chemotaxis protein
VIVDDEPAVLQAAARLIERFGHQVTRFDSPNGLLAQFGELEPPPSLVLTDLSMPGINGWELARALRARHPAVPVVVMTGNLDLASESADGVAMAARSDRAPHPDVADVLGKPFTAAELRAVLERCLP